MTGKSQIITTFATDDPMSSTSDTNNTEMVDSGQAANSSNFHLNNCSQRESPINETFENEMSNSNPFATTTIPVGGVRNIVTRFNANEISIGSPKQLYIRDDTIIYIVDRFELNEKDRNAPINSIHISIHTEIVNCDMKKINDDIETRQDDPPVIYDENQLNVGSNPILEDN
ncbi:hypothetical protein EVAR_81226_1 [Eumeta japonica]|uniref:Uncharacterized protein n=1 Tax=Eumeta variegata TaxID=151549 RepID=A0A4C1V1M6_EUMVA|nr:hypothetical protein EVAR_81226_1 [Eumeta japonica]